MRTASVVLTLIVSLALVASLSAAEQGKGGKKGGGGGGAGAFDPFGVPPSIKLTDAQKAKIEDLRKELGPKMKDAQTKADAMLTDEQKAKLAEARKGGREAMMAAEKALNLTEDQKTKRADARKAMMELRTQIQDKVAALLTPEQKAELDKAREAMKSKGGKGGKKQ